MRLLNENQDFLLRQTWKVTLVRTAFVRAVVEADRVVFMCPNHKVFPAFLEELRVSMRKPTEHEFSSLVIEALVCATVSLATMRWKMLQPVVERMLAGLRLDDHDYILKLYPLRIAVQSFIQQMKPLVDRLHNPILPAVDKPRDRNGSADDGSTQPGQSFVAASEGPATSFTGTTGSFGLLLPSMEVALSINDWGFCTQHLLVDAEDFNQRIDDALRFLEASMSCTRNRLLYFELWTTVATVVLGAGALVSGIFGMNVRTGLEDLQGAFDFILVSMLCMALFIVLALLWAIGRSKRHFERNRTCFGNNKFFTNIMDDSYVMTFMDHELPSLAHAADVEACDRVMKELRKPA